MRDLASAGIEEFPKTLELVKEQFRCFSPPRIMAPFATYAFAVCVDDSGTEQRALPEHINLDHAELLQALLLSIPREECGREAPSPEVMQVRIDNLPKLTNILFHQRIREAEEPSDEQTRQMKVDVSMKIGSEWMWSDSQQRVSENTNAVHKYARGAM